MNGIYQHYIIDLSSNNNFVHIPTVQGDGNNVRGFEVELIENGVQYIVDKNDCMICIMGTKPDTSQIMNDCTVSDEGYILVNITSQMSAVKGRGDYQIVLMNRSTNSQLKSFPFHIFTTPAAFDIDYIVSSDEFQTLTRNIFKTEEVINDANQTISDVRTLETSVKNAEAGRVDAENKRVSAENIRSLNENTRISNENARKSNETNRQNAETSRVNAENVRVTAENTRVINENTRISNENTRKSSENNRQTAEVNRQNAETERVNAEIERVNTENTRISNENTRKSAENTRASEESKRDSAENIRKTNESTRQTNESIRQSNESDRQTNTATAINNTEKATDRANKAAKACENIILGTGMIMQTEKGAANGVATLDENKKLTRSQLPVTELISSTEPASSSQNVGDFWLQEY